MSYTFDEQTVSDLHKDASGHRPGDGFWQMRSTASDDKKQTIWDGLLTDLEYSISSEKEADRQAAAAFESLVTKTIEMGAVTVRPLFAGCLKVAKTSNLPSGIVVSSLSRTASMNKKLRRFSMCKIIGDTLLLTSIFVIFYSLWMVL